MQHSASHPRALSHLLLSALFLISSLASAATYTYDADANATNGITEGNTSQWNTGTTAAWFDGTTDVVWPAAVDATDDTAVFGFGGTAGTGSGTAGTVSVGTVTTNGITFATTNAGNYTLNSGTISFAGATPTITTNVNANINSRIVAPVLIKTGAGMLVLNNSTSDIDNLTVNQGILDVFSVFNADVLNVTGSGRLTTHSGNTSVFGAVNHSSTQSSVFVASNTNSTYTIGAGGLNISGTGQIIIESNNTDPDPVAPVSKLILQGNITATETTKITTAGAAGLDANRLLDLDAGIRNVDVSTGKTFSIEAITQNGGLTKSGNGTLILTKANTYALHTAINAGTLRVTGTGTLGATTNNLTIASGAILDLGGTDQIVEQLTGSGTVTSNATSGSLAVGGGNSNSTFDGVITGTTTGFTSLIKNGTGTLTLTAASTYSGGTIVNGGILAGTDSTNYGSTAQIKKMFGTGSITLNAGTTLQVRANGNNANTTETLNLGNNLIVTAPSTIDVARAAGTTASTKTIKFGTLAMSAAANLLTVKAPNSYSVEVSAPTIAADTTFDVQSGSLVFISNLANTNFAITKIGAGRLTLRAGQTGNITVNAGILDVYGAPVSGDVAFNGSSALETHSGDNWSMNSLTLNTTATTIEVGAFSASSTYTVGAGGLHIDSATNLSVRADAAAISAKIILKGNAEITANSAIVKNTGATSLGTMRLDLDGGTRTFDVASGRTFALNIITENGGITKTGAGIMTLSDANTYAGNTTINQGTLRLASTGSISNSLRIAVATSAIYDVSAIAGGYTLAAAQTLEGGGAIQGNTTIASGAFLSGGTTGVDATQTLSFASSLTLKSGSVTTLDLSSTPSDIDHLSVTGNFTQEAGAKIVITANGLSLSPNQSYDLFTLLGATNTFSGNLGANLRDGASDSGFDLDLPDISAAGYMWDISQFTSNGIITAIAVPEPSRALLALLAIAACLIRRRRRC